MARNRYSGSIKPPSACTLEFLRFGVSDVSLTLSQFRGGNIRHAWLTARENSSLIYLIDPTYIYIYIYRKEEKGELNRPSFLSLFFDRIPFLEAVVHIRFHLPRRSFPLVDMNVEHLPARSTAVSGYLHPRCKRINRFACRMRWHTGSHQQGRTTWFFTVSYGNDLDILSLSRSLSFVLSLALSPSLSLSARDGRVVKVSSW